MLENKDSYVYDNEYLCRFFKLDVAPALMAAKLFPNIKEVTESVGAFAAIKNHINIGRSDDVDVFVVGDGHTPRTGALIASLTKWNVKSIDPQMRQKKWGIKRLETYRNTAEELKFHGRNNCAILVCVHSHAPISSCLQMLDGYSEVHLVNIPCCFPADIEQQADVSYVDTSIQSPKQRVDIFLRLSGTN